MSYESKNIRNVTLLGHSGSGKTTLCETMLFESKSIHRRGSVSDGNTVSDYTNIEKERGNTVFSTLMHANWRDCKINILDTPGSDDFIGEIVSSLKVADTGVVVLNAANGVEVGTEIIWEYIQNNKTPALLVVNQVDHDKSDFEATLEQARDRFGTNVLAVQYPLNQGKGFTTIVDALRMTMYEFSQDGGKPTKIAIPESEMIKAQEMHNALVEAAAENDEGLMEKFFEEGALSEKELAKGLTIALANQEIFPVFCCCAEKNMGSGRIMGFINDIAPSPADRPTVMSAKGKTVMCDANAPNIAFIFKTISEPQVGMLSYFKVYSGKVKAGEELYNPTHRVTERIGSIFETNGKIRTSVTELQAGDIGVTVKLKNSHSNETLVQKGTEIEIEKMIFPNHRYRTAIVPPSKGDMEKIMKALNQIAIEDPTLEVEQSATLRQTLLHGQGQLHLELIKYRIEKVNGLEIEFAKPKIPYRETITQLAEASYRHKKQSGGSGQFAELSMRIEPYYEGMPDPLSLNVRKKTVEELSWGGHLAFYWCIVGGSIDVKYINAIKKGVIQKMEEGPLTGSRCQNIRVCIYDGKMHSVDSNDMAFMIAASHAFKSAFIGAKPQLMEPIYSLDILCNDSVMGDIMGDLQTRRAMIQGMSSEGHYQKISAKVPLSELYKYSVTLRSMSQGRAKFTRSFVEFAPVPQEIQKNLTKSHNADAEAA
ncbi:MAG: elongation factor G [Saprospiraceae bacterium]